MKEEGESMDIESNLSLEAIRKSLLEKEQIKAKCLIDEDESISLPDLEKLKRLKANVECNDYIHCRYLGNGAFEETIF